MFGSNPIICVRIWGLTCGCSRELMASKTNIDVFGITRSTALKCLFQIVLESVMKVVWTIILIGTLCMQAAQHFTFCLRRRRRRRSRRRRRCLVVVVVDVVVVVIVVFIVVVVVVAAAIVVVIVVVIITIIIIIMTIPMHVSITTTNCEICVVELCLPY